MNILVLIPRPRRIEYAFFGDNSRKALLESHLSGLPPEREAMINALGKIRADCTMFNAATADLVVIRSVYGGTAFTRTTRVDEDMLSRFAALNTEAPIHIPPVHLLAQASLQAFAEATVVMAFETAFFVNLPVRERRYGIADDRVRRFGYHGLYHQAAGMERDGSRKNGSTRTLSLCLEPQPEMAASIGNQPVMVTSGATPLEGLPGETTCGELDPTIVLTIARSMKWGPEQINNMLTRQSGLYALMGRPFHLGDLLASCNWSMKEGRLPDAADGMQGAARNIVAYQILLAAGAGVAAMGGLDRIVLSGRYADQCRSLGNWLTGRLCSAESNSERPAVVTFRRLLSRILADQGASIALP